MDFNKQPLRLSRPLGLEGAVANIAEPGVEVPTTVVLADDRVVGYCSTLPIELWDGRVTHPGYWVKGLMVLPE